MGFHVLILCALNSLQPTLSRCGTLQMGKKTKLASEVTHTSQDKTQEWLYFSLPIACHWKAVSVSQPGGDFSQEEFTS